jgi:hypothetical protein
MAYGTIYSVTLLFRNTSYSFFTVIAMILCGILGTILFFQISKGEIDVVDRACLTAFSILLILPVSWDWPPLWWGAAAGAPLLLVVSRRVTINRGKLRWRAARLRKPRSASIAGP